MILVMMIFGAGCCIACCSKKPPVDPDADMAGGGRGRGYVYLLLFFSCKNKYEKHTTLGHYHIVDIRMKAIPETCHAH
jgi:hypothetical protein